MNATETDRFQWELEDGWDEGREESRVRWSREHTAEGLCPGCCCGGVFACSRCGDRMHSEPVSAYDIDGNEVFGHAFYCQGERTADGAPATVREVGG